MHEPQIEQEAEFTFFSSTFMIHLFVHGHLFMMDVPEPVRDSFI